MHSLTTQPEAPAQLDGSPQDAAAIARRCGAALVAALATAELVAATGLVPGPLGQLSSLLSVAFFCAALGGSFLLHAASRRPLGEKLIAAAAGLTAALPLTRLSPSAHPLLAAGAALGLASVAVLAVRSWRLSGAARAAVLDVLLPAVLLPGFVLVSGTFVALTAALHPTTLDAHAFHADAAFGVQPSFAVGLLFAALPAVKAVSTAVYVLLPLAFVAIQAVDLRANRRAAPQATVAFLAVAALGYAVYFLFPVAGPVYVFPKFPAHAPAPAAVPLEPLLVAPVPRNCMPSLHTAWALMAYWLARTRARWLRVAAAGFLLFTLLATLGLGYHYLVDLVAALPFTAVAFALLSEVEPRLASLRRRTIVGGAAAFTGWLALVRFAPDLLAGAPAAMWLAAAALATASWVAVGRLQRGAPVAPAAGSATARPHRAPLAVSGLFFASGFAALCYEIVFAKAFATTFGSTARAATTVLAVYMGGLALGSWMGGRFASRVARPLRAFALVELGVAGWCALFPLAVRAVRAAYLALAAGTDPGAPWLVLLQMGLQAVALLPATLLMGCSLPLLARHASDGGEEAGSAVGALYAVNTAGAAAGAVTSGYLLLPALGISRTMLSAALLDVLVAVLGLRLARGPARAAARPAAVAPSVDGSPPGSERLARFAWVALCVTSLGGVLTFALETTYVHLLAVIAGNSAYAFALMVFAFLVGLSAGAAAGRRLLRTGAGLPALLAGCQLALAAVLLVGVHLWDRIPAHFASYERYPLARTFGAREAVRFAVCSAAMMPPALVVGAAYPVVMAWIGAAAGRARAVGAIGRAGALNTAGNIAGALLGGCVLIPHAGSLRAVQVIAGGALGLGLLALVAAERRGPWAAAAAVVALLFLAQPSSFDYTRLASGANVYFATQAYGRVVDHAESQDGGLTTVSESLDPGGRRVLTMLTNGKFQGDDGDDREMTAQLSFSLVPLLHEPERGPALIIGLGTGVSARVASDAGFSPLHVAELSRDVADLASRHFGKVNAGVLARPETVLHVADGRNLLALEARRYGFIGVEISSIWFAGAANLYNREFYRLARSRLTERGVLQQWLQLHHLSRGDVASILASARAEFPRVWLYVARNQGVMVACQWECQPTSANVERLLAEPRLAPDLQRVGGIPALLESRVLAPDDVDALLRGAAERGLDVEQLVSTDDNLLLEYGTPRGNARPYGASLRDNLEFVTGYSPRTAVAGTALTDADWDALAKGPRAGHP